MDYIDTDGNIHKGPNPAIADVEQLPMPAAIQTITGPIVNEKPERKRTPYEGDNPYWTGNPDDYGGYGG